MAGPVLIGILLSWATFKINPAVNSLKMKKPISELLKPIWKFAYPISIIGWFLLWPGLILLGAVGIVPDAAFVYALPLISLIAFILTIFSAIAYDKLENRERHNE